MCYLFFYFLRVVVDSIVEMDLISCCGKIVFKGKDVEEVDCYIVDEIVMLKLIFWEEYI